MHWLMLLLIAAVYACIELRELYERGSETREALKTWHYMLGLSVFVLVWVRLIAWITGPSPAIVPTPPKWQVWAAKAMHIGLYGLMIGLPIGGWLILSAEGKEIPFFGFNLPALIAENEDAAEQIEGLHKRGGVIGYYLIGLHAAAALFHHYVLRDNGLRRMLPGRD
jgi:cytochrome b561